MNVFYFCLVVSRRAVYLVGQLWQRSNIAALHCIAMEARKHTEIFNDKRVASYNQFVNQKQGAIYYCSFV